MRFPTSNSSVSTCLTSTGERGFNGWEVCSALESVVSFLPVLTTSGLVLKIATASVVYQRVDALLADAPVMFYAECEGINFLELPT